MSELNNICNGMRDAFKAAKRANDERRDMMTSCLPNGEFIDQIQFCGRKKAKDGPNWYVEVQHNIREGELKGKIEYQRFMLLPDRIQSLLSFFEAFSLDTVALINAEDIDAKIDEYCEIIHRASPIVRIVSKRWYRKNKETGEVTDEVGGTNIYIKAIIEDHNLSGNALEETSTEETITDDLDAMSRAELTHLIQSDENLDISLKFIRDHSEDEIRDEIRKQRNSISSDNKESSDELRENLLAICESQGIDKQEADENNDIYNLTCEEIIKTMSTYTFNTEGDGSLTKEEVSTLIEAGLDANINKPELKPEPKKPAIVKKSLTKKR